MSRTDIAAIGGDGGDWKEYRRLVLRELERLDKQLRTASTEAGELRSTLTAMREQVEHARQAVEKLSEIGAGLENRVNHNEQTLARIQGRAAGLGAVGGGAIAVLAEALLRALGV